MRSLLGVIAAFLFLASAARSETVDLELVLMADASGSIDASEIRFQRESYAEALASADVQTAIKSGVHQKIAITYVEWADQFSQDVVVPWTMIASADDAKTFGDQLLAAPRKARGRNAIGSALDAGEKLITGNAHEGLRKVIDFSGDSANSWNGIGVAEARQSAIDKGITINGLAILCRECTSGRAADYDLEKAFAETIIGGPNAFVITADGPATFRQAVRRKLVLEIAGRMPIGQTAASEWNSVPIKLPKTLTYLGRLPDQQR
jgi:Protein of unknown function (DUF1194)